MIVSTNELNFTRADSHVRPSAPTHAYPCHMPYRNASLPIIYTIECERNHDYAIVIVARIVHRLYIIDRFAHVRQHARLRTDPPSCQFHNHMSYGC